MRPSKLYFWSQTQEFDSVQYTICESQPPPQIKNLVASLADITKWHMIPGNVAREKSTFNPREHVSQHQWAAGWTVVFLRV